MSLLSALKTVGKDLSHVGTWIEDGLKVVAPVAGVVFPALSPIITEIENVLAKIPPTAINASNLQAIVTAVATLEGLKVTVPPTGS